MAYFSNGTEGEVLDMQCAECLPFAPCPVALVQAEFNYSQCGEGQELLRKALNYLVDEKGNCQMKQYIKPQLDDPDETAEKKRAKVLLCGKKLEFGNIQQIEALKKITGE